MLSFSAACPHACLPPQTQLVHTLHRWRRRRSRHWWRWRRRWRRRHGRRRRHRRQAAQAHIPPCPSGHPAACTCPLLRPPWHATLHPMHPLPPAQLGLATLAVPEVRRGGGKWVGGLAAMRPRSSCRQAVNCACHPAAACQCCACLEGAARARKLTPPRIPATWFLHPGSACRCHRRWGRRRRRHRR